MLPILIHGDAAFAGQGVVVEIFNLSQLRGYRTGGTVHIVINNQVGFTTSTLDARSSFYATDVAKTVAAPIIHVNGDDPEAVWRVARLAFAFRQAFNRDVVIDMICYRRRGHNEGDEPSYTQPLMYKLIDQMRSVRKLYMERLVNTGDISVEDGRGSWSRSSTSSSTTPSRRPGNSAPAPPARAHATDERQKSRPPPCRSSELEEILRFYITIPPADFIVHPKLRKVIGRAVERLRSRSLRLGHRRGSGDRLDRARGIPGPAGRRGFAPGHLQPSSRRAHLLRHRASSGRRCSC